MKVEEKYKKIDTLRDFLNGFSLQPAMINDLLTQKETNPIVQKQKAGAILLRPQLFLKEMIDHVTEIQDYAELNGLLMNDVIEETEIKIKYESYIGKEQELVDKLANLENFPLAGDFDYSKLISLSHEAREKLHKVKPRTLGQASRISGVSPADISVLMISLGR